MRAIMHPQLWLAPLPTNTRTRRDYEKMSKALDAHPELLTLVHADYSRDVAADKGRNGLSAEQGLRALIIMRQHHFSYEELELHLNDSLIFRWFCRLEPTKTVSGSALNRAIKPIRPETIEELNKVIVKHAKDEGIENGRTVRTDCTAVETTIHQPTDSLLLWDGVRVLTRLMKEAKQLASRIEFSDHTRRAKKRAFAIENAKNKEQRRPLYEDLVVVTQKTVSYAEQAVAVLKSASSVAALACATSLSHFLELTKKVIKQTHERVIEGRSVSAQDKIVSLFEEHTDIISKGKRDPVYGHKICVTGGGSGMILDCRILDGNPADSTLTIEMMERLVEIYGQAPRQAVFDGAFRSIVNLDTVKDMGVKDVVFTKSRGIDIEDMARSEWVYKKLRRFRAGIEGTISYLKRTFGLDRCTWRGLRGFKSYVWGSIFSANLLTIARKST